VVTNLLREKKVKILWVKTIKMFENQIPDPNATGGLYVPPNIL
jgi:hypothetical protein